MKRIISFVLCAFFIFSVCSIPVFADSDSDTDTEVELTPLNEIVVDNEILPDITEIVTNQPFYFIVKSGSNINLYVAYGAIRYRFAESNNKLYLYCHSTENETNSTAYYIQFLYDNDNWVRQAKIVGSINLSYGTILYSSVDLYYNDSLYFGKNLEDFNFIYIDTDNQLYDFDNSQTAQTVVKFIDTFSSLFRLLFVFFLMWLLYKFFNIFF